MLSDEEMLNGRNRLRLLFVIQFILVTAGFSSLLKISSEYLADMVYLEDFSNYYAPYLIWYGLGMASLVHNAHKGSFRISARNVRISVYAFTLLFALIMTCANYSLWFLPLPEYSGHLFRNMYRMLYIVMIFFGSGCASYNILFYLSDLSFLWKACNHKKRSSFVFLTAFALIIFIDLTILLLCKYPGNLQTDSFAQIYQAMGDFEPSNHHPFYHTLVIKLFLNAGLALFGRYNAAVAVYSVFQIVFMAACFAYGIMFLYDIKAPRWIIVSVTVIYAIAPYHIMYSFSMTKDTMFAGFVLVSVVSFYRILSGIGDYNRNVILTVLSGLGVCLFRSNGLFVYVLWTVCVFLLYRKIIRKKNGYLYRKILFWMLGVILVSFIMKYPVLKILNVHQTDFVESLSIPIQQIGRTVKDKDNLTDAQQELLSKVLDIDKIRESYYHTSSDPLKERIRAEGDEDYLISHKKDFLILYINVGLKHPTSYAAAWIDQTYGFWNAGYKDWHWYDWVDPGIFDNRYDIHRVVISGKLNNIFNEYLWLFEEYPLLQLFLCMGLHMWISLILLYISVIRVDRAGLLIILPIVWILISLMLATPLSMEFRYFYAVFCVLPTAVPAVLRQDISEQTDLEDI